jgi:hypothetical protein
VQVTLPSFPEPENRDDAVNGLGFSFQEGFFELSLADASDIKLHFSLA